MNAIEQTTSAPPTLSWLKRVVRYSLHLIVFYQIVRLSTDSLASLIYRALLLPSHGSPSFQASAQFLFSHLFAFSCIPAFVAGLAINARFRHQAACYIWIVPLAILAVAFLFIGPGIYPTMLWESDFREALHHFFGRGFHFVSDMGSVNELSDWRRAYTQVRFTVPAYGAAAYSFGAFLGMSTKSRRLQAFMAKF
jgi:hypothetical protein